MLGPAVVIALVSFAETYSVGKAISAETIKKYANVYKSLPASYEREENNLPLLVKGVRGFFQGSSLTSILAKMSPDL